MGIGRSGTMRFCFACCKRSVGRRRVAEGGPGRSGRTPCRFRRKLQEAKRKRRASPFFHFSNAEAALFRDPKDPLAFSYSAYHPLAGELEKQTTQLLREYKMDAQYLSPHAPEVPGVHDDAPTAVALALLAASMGRIGDIVLL